MKLTQKETMFLNDLKEHEQICIEKYSKYASQANDKQLKNLFTQLSQMESQHLDTLNQIASGTVPQMQAGGQEQQQQPTFKKTYNESQNNEEKNNDSFLCTDLLSTEKHVSSVYNTSVFEFKDTNIRKALNHIQKEEQEHGEKLYNYMAMNGMYSEN